MPGMLVYLDPDRLAALRGTAGERWTIRRGELLDPELLRQPDWTLYVATARDARARIVAYLERVAEAGDELGEAASCDVDVTPILERLGCTGGVGSFAAWAAAPRVLTPGDSDLLRYRLGLPLTAAPAPPPPPPAPAPAPSPPPAPAIGFAHDPVAQELLAAVYDDLASDANRMVLADRLLELGDPRGEMIALQLARARTGAPPTPRERELIAQHGHAWARPLTPCLVSYGFRRGFLATAAVDDRATMRLGIYEHPAWTTVEELETTNASLVLSPALRSLRRLATSGALLRTLAVQAEPLDLETIVGITAIHRDRLQPRPIQGGIALPLHDLGAIAETAVLDRVRSMSLAIDTPQLAERVELFLGGRFGRRLAHIEVFHPHLAAVDPEPWRRVYDDDQPLSLGIRGVVDDWLAVIVRQRDSIVLQLGEPMTGRPPNLGPIVPALALLGQRQRVLTVERVGDDGTGIDLRPAIEELRRVFRVVALAAAPRWRSP